MSKTHTVAVQELVQKAIDEMVESGSERALQVAVYHRGVQVVDAVAGLADPATSRPMSSETPVYCYSVCKAAASTLMHRLAERGAFDYQTKVAEVWPEFGARGKALVSIRHVLNHTAGVPGIPLTTTIEDLCDWDKMCAAIADAELWWEPGTKIGYHAYTFGYIVGEIIRRVTGKPLSQVLIDELAAPLGVEKELYFGMPRAEHRRLAVLEDAPMPPNFQMPAMPPDLPMFKAAPMSLMPDAAFGNRTDTLAADIPAGEATTAPVSGVDEVFGMPTTWALGYSIGAPGQSSDTAFGVGGVGGSFAFGDSKTGVAFALTKNRLTSDFNASAQVIRLVEEAIAGKA